MPRHASRLACLALLLGASAASARMAPQQSAAGASTAPSTGAAALDAAAEERRAARELVERGDGDFTVLTLAVQKLLDLGDLSTLRLVLTGEAARPLGGLLRALEKLEPRKVEPLLPEILGAAAHQTSEPIRSQAQADLRALAQSRDSTVESCIGWLADPALDTAQRVAAIDALGESRHLVAVEPLIAALAGQQSVAAREALTSLTRHDLGPTAGVTEWTAWWEQNRGVSREVLIERAMDLQKSLHDRQLLAKTAEVVRSRMDRMDGLIEKLIAGLGDEYPEVRLEAARRLAGHENKERAATAVPVLLRRLGHAVSGNGGSFAADASGADNAPAGAGNGAANGGSPSNAASGAAPAPGGPAAAGVPVPAPTKAAPAPPAPLAPLVQAGADADAAITVETDPGVRAQFVATAGLLGRARDDVRVALLDELTTSPYGAVTAAAAAALCTLRDQPSVVAPLLDYLDRVPGEENAIAVLQAVALDRPTGVIPRLAALAAAPQLPRVRAAAVRALMASENPALALDRVQAVVDADTSTDVHFAAAVALGDRVRALAADAPERPRIVSLLQSLLDDVASSVRVEAAAALGRTGAATALGLLEKRASAETEPSVVVAIVQALGALKLPEAAPVIGRIVAQRRNPPIGGLEPAAQSALSVLGDQRPPEQWLLLGEALERAEAHALAAWCYAELVRQFEPRAAARDAVAQARAGRARALVAAGQAEEALQLLEQLATETAPFSSEAERLELQARANEQLGRFGPAADFWGRRFALLPDGESSRLATRRAWATALRKAGRHADALKQLRELLAQDATNNTLLYESAQVEEALGQYAEAQTDLDRLLGRLGDTEAALRVEVQAAVDRVRALLAAAAPAAGAANAPATDGSGKDVPKEAPKEGATAPATAPLGAAPSGTPPTGGAPATPAAVPSPAPAPAPQGSPSDKPGA